MAAPTQVNILDAKNQLSRLVREAAAGREIVIARNGTPVAKLVPIRRKRTLGGWGVLRGKVRQVDAAFAPAVEAEVARLLTEGK